MNKILDCGQEMGDDPLENQLRWAGKETNRKACPEEGKMKKSSSKRERSSEKDSYGPVFAILECRAEIPPVTED